MCGVDIHMSVSGLSNLAFISWRIHNRPTHATEAVANHRETDWPIYSALVSV